MKKLQELQSHTKSKKTDKQDSLIEYKEVENTPFTIVKKVEENDEINYFVLFGKYRISEALKTEEEATEQATTIDWWKIMSVAHAIAEQIIEQNEIKKLTKNNKK